MPCYNSGTNRVGCKRDIVFPSSRIVIKRCTIANSINGRITRLLFSIHQVGSILIELQMILSESGIGLESYRADHHVCRILSFIRLHGRNLSFSKEFFYFLSQCQTNTVLLQSILDFIRERRIKVSCQDMIDHIHKGYGESQTAERFSELHTDIAASQYTYILECRFVLYLLDYFQCILIQLHHLHIFQIESFHGKLVRKRARSQNQLIVVVFHDFSAL